MRPRVLGGVLAVSIGLAAGMAHGQVQVRHVDYHGWTQAVEIANAEVRVVVVPEIGRIMYFGFQAGENILWNDAAQYGRVLPRDSVFTEDGEPVWTNFGGDKVWPTEQDDFARINGHSWPPDHWFDGGRHGCGLLPDGVRLSSPLSAYNGARSVRTIRLAPRGTQLTIHQQLEKVQVAARRQLEPLRYTIWSVTQIVMPEQVLFPLNPHSCLAQRFHVWDDAAAAHFHVLGDTGVFLPDSTRAQKSGVDADGWLAAIVGYTVMAEFFHRQADRPYPDGGLSAEAYSCPDYTELELLSPLQSLRVGESLSFSIRWELHPLGANLQTAAARRAAALDWLRSVAGE